VTKKSADKELAGGLEAGELPGSKSCARAVGTVDSAYTGGISSRAAEFAPQHAGSCRTRLTIFATALAIAILLVTSNTWSQSRRQIVDTNTFPWSSIGKLNNSAGGQCTAAVIGPNQFLTAAHCLYNAGAGRFISPGSIHFLLGYEKGEYRLQRAAVRYFVPSTFDPSKINEPIKVLANDWAANDWAILDTSEPFPADIRPLRIASVTPSPGKAVMTVGYAQERAYMMTADQHCRIRFIFPDGKLIAHDCVTHHGDSGGPLLSADGGDEGVILGINIFGYSSLAELRDHSKEGGGAISAAKIAELAQHADFAMQIGVPPN
jgi:protease YdgD